MIELIVNLLCFAFAFLFLDWPHGRVRWYPWAQYPDSLQTRIHDALIRWWLRLFRR